MTKSNEEIINEMQQVVQQMVIDDLEENPDIANDFSIVIVAEKTKTLLVLFSMVIIDYVMIVFYLQKQVLH